jgi:polysaccharide biosynthesis protein PslH
MMPETFPSVGVVIPCHNYEAFLGAAIDSVLAQTRRFAEIVVVDDGSTDGSASVVESYGLPVRLVQQANAGQLSACLAGLSHLRSDYVYFLDADDMATSDLVETIEPLLATRPAKLQFPLEAVDASGVPTGSVFPSFPSGYGSSDMARDNAAIGFYICPPTSGNVYQRGLLLQPGFDILNGRDFIDGTPVLVMPYLGDVISVDRPLARYRVHGENHSQWDTPSPQLLGGEVDRFNQRWKEACSLLQRPQPPFGSKRPAYVLERQLMTSALQRTIIDPRLLIRLLSQWWASRIPYREKLVLSVWSILLLLPSPRWRTRLVRMRRAPGARPAVVRAIARAVGVAGGIRGNKAIGERVRDRAPSPPPGRPAALDRAGVRSVVVAKNVPWPPNSGDKIRTLGIVRALARLGPVTVCAFEGPDEDPGPLREEGIDVRSVQRLTSPTTVARGLIRGQSITAARFWDPRLADLVRCACAEGTDILVLEHIQLFPYRAGCDATTTVLDMHNIESSLTARFAASHRGPRRAVLQVESRALRRLERTADVDVVVVVSDADRERLPISRLVREVVVVPNAWAQPEPLEPTDEPVATFVALMSWAPNVDAAVWFAHDVWPLVTAEMPAARLQLVGRNPAPLVRALAQTDSSISVTGTVDDLRPYYARTRVALAPLLAGGGSRLKILEALSYARPIVATTVGAEGLEDLVGRGVVVADDPAGIARCVAELLGSPERANQLGQLGAGAVRVAHGWDAATRPLTDHLTAVLRRAR